ncbi:T31J12.3 PROTEIN-RELATED [Salix koriyanagi]|uniref:T31J12.3 PROTEIN-RELATED n=1 Tax=Salix koriyanagi TaxID=2511006 RepID=A0A9Q0UEX9_9ROSI|nr:T31J12.3 PROTEIN-RELATED [Salix koriyanagi]
MSLTQTSFLPFFLSLIFLLSTITATTATLQNLLQSQGLPGGLFPNNVKSYNLDQNGRLEVHLDGPCMTRYEARVVFDSVVRANLSYGGLMGLEGLIQEELFLWFPVKGFLVKDPSSGLILVDIGLAHKQLSRSIFEVPPVCKPQGADLSENLGRKMGFQAQR